MRRLDAISAEPAKAPKVFAVLFQLAFSRRKNGVYSVGIIYILFRREGWEINHKRVYRLYCEEGLLLRKKMRKTQEPQ